MSTYFKISKDKPVYRLDSSSENNNCRDEKQKSVLSLIVILYHRNKPLWSGTGTIMV